MWKEIRERTHKMHIIFFKRERKKYARVAIGTKCEPSRSHFEYLLFSFFYDETSKLPQYSYLMHELNSRLHMDALAASLKLLTTVVWRCKCKILDFSQWIIHWNGHKTMTAYSRLKKMFSILLTFFIGCHGEFIFSDL